MPASCRVVTSTARSALHTLPAPHACASNRACSRPSDLNHRHRMSFPMQSAFACMHVPCPPALHRPLRPHGPSLSLRHFVGVHLPPPTRSQSTPSACLRPASAYVTHQALARPHQHPIILSRPAPAPIVLVKPSPPSPPEHRFAHLHAYPFSVCVCAISARPLFASCRHPPSAQRRMCLPVFQPRAVRAWIWVVLYLVVSCWVALLLCCACLRLSPPLSLRMVPTLSCSSAPRIARDVCYASRCP